MWLGWRGLSHEGRSPDALPLTWDAQKGILWRVPIPGSGHSSPIADADRIYVSTAYADGVGMLPMLLDGAIVGLATLLPILAAQRVLALAGSSTLSSSALLIRAAANIAIALTLFVVAWLGEGLFDFPRCDIRGWLASSCVVTLSLGLAIEGGKSRIGRLLGAAAAAAFAITVAFGCTVPRPRVPRRCTCAQCAGRLRDISVAAFSRAHHRLGRGLRATVAATWSPARACERSGGRSAAASSSFSQ